MKKVIFSFIRSVKHAITDGATVGLFFWMLDVAQSPEITICAFILSLGSRVWRVI